MEHSAIRPAHEENVLSRFYSNLISIKMANEKDHSDTSDRVLFTFRQTGLQYERFSVSSIVLNN